jgi:hypothetical protein
VTDSVEYARRGAYVGDEAVLSFIEYLMQHPSAVCVGYETAGEGATLDG